MSRTLPWAFGTFLATAFSSNATTVIGLAAKAWSVARNVSALAAVGPTTTRSGMSLRPALEVIYLVFPLAFAGLAVASSCLSPGLGA